MGVEDVSEELLASIIGLGELVQPYYQSAFDEIAIDVENGRYFVVTDRFDYSAQGDQPSIRVEVIVGVDNVITIIEGSKYVSALFDASEGLMSSVETQVVIDSAASDWGIDGVVGDNERYGILTTTENFATAYGQLLDFLTEITALHSGLMALSVIRSVN
jgi:hypothetical protein